MKMFPTPDRRSDGSRWDHMILIGRALRLSKFIVSRARSAEGRREREGEGEGEGEEESEGSEGEIRVCVNITGALVPYHKQVSQSSRRHSRASGE